MSSKLHWLIHIIKTPPELVWRGVVLPAVIIEAYLALGGLLLT